MPRSKDVSAIFNKFITNFRSVLDREVAQAVAKASKEVLKGKRRVKTLASPSMAGKPGYSKYGKKLGRLAKGKST